MGSILLTGFYAILFYILLDLYRKKKLVQLNRAIFSLFYVLKLTMAFALLALYTYYYSDRSTADIYKYFDDSLVIHELAKSHFATYLKLLLGISLNDIEHQLIIETQHWDSSSLWGGFGNRIMTRIHLLIHWFSFSNIWVHAVFFNALSVLGFLWIYRSLSGFFRQSLFIIFAFLIPTVLFWSSGMLKEAVLLLFIGMLFNGIYTIRNESKFSGGLSILLSLFGIALLKLYLLIPLIPVLLAYLLNRYSYLKKYSVWWSIVIAVPISFVFIHFTSALIFQKSFIDLLMLRYNEFYDLAVTQNAGSLLVSNSVSAEGSWIWFLDAIRHTWLMPWPWTGGGLLTRIAGIEHLFFVLSLIFTAFVFRKMKYIPGHLFLFSLFFLYAILLFQIIGLTVPVLGAIVRYEMPGLLLAMLFILYIWDQYFVKTDNK